MIVICEEIEIFSEVFKQYFKQLQRLFIRAAEGQHILFFTEPEKVIGSYFFKQAVAPMDEKEWEEMVVRTSYALDKESWTTDSFTVFEKLHVNLSAKEGDMDTFCLYCVLPEEAGTWAEMPLKVLMENISDWAVIKGAIWVYDKQVLKEACEKKWIEPYGCGGKDEIMKAVKRNSNSKTRLAVFADSDKVSPDAEIGDTQKKIKIECEKRKIPCHILEKRMIENYIPNRIFKEIAQKADPVQRKKIEEWEKFPDEKKNFGDPKNHFKSRKVKSILPFALETMGISDNFTKSDLEDRAGKELKQIINLLEKYL